MLVRGEGSVVRGAVVGALVIGVLSAVMPAARGADAVASVEDDRFVPRVVSIGVGEAVTWSRGPGSIGPHNVREDGRLFRSGPVTTGPVDFAARFSAGTFHYFCEAHGSPAGGMDGVVRVAPRVLDRPAGPRFRVSWATGKTATGSLFDVQFRDGRRRWETWKEDVRAKGAVFGKRGTPVRVRRGTRYRFRVRSQRGREESRWSPVARFRA